MATVYSLLNPIDWRYRPSAIATIIETIIANTFIFLKNMIYNVGNTTVSLIVPKVVSNNQRSILNCVTM